MRLLALCLLLLPAVGFGSDLIDLGDVPDGEHTYRVVVKDGQIVQVLPLRVFKAGGQPPNPPPVTPDDPNLSAFSNEVRRQTAAVLAQGGSKTTGAGLSAVYSLVADGVADGSIATDKAFSYIKAASDAVMAAQSDRDKWTAWRASISQSLNTLQTMELLKTKEQIAGVLNEIAAGMDKATGNTLEPTVLSNVKPAAVLALDKDGTADGILDGIDLAKLIELIKMIMELIKLFSGGF